VLIHSLAIFLVVAIALVLLVVGVIRNEARFVAERFGDAFCENCQRVGRYSP